MLLVASFELLVEDRRDVGERCVRGRGDGATVLDVHAPIASTALVHATTRIQRITPS